MANIQARNAGALERRLESSRNRIGVLSLDQDHKLESGEGLNPLEVDDITSKSKRKDEDIECDGVQSVHTEHIYATWFFLEYK